MKDHTYISRPTREHYGLEKASLIAAVIFALIIYLAG